MGQIFALLCAVLWAVAVILLKRSGDTIRPFALNLFRVGVSSVLLVLTVLISGQGLFREATLTDLITLLIGGGLSIALADTMFHKCLNTVGAGITAIVDCLYSPLMILFAFLLLDERIGAWDFVGMGLVIAAVLVASTHPIPIGMTRKMLVQGVLWGAGAMTTLTGGVIIVKPVLTHHPILWVTTVRQLGALAIMVPIALVSPRRHEFFSVFKPHADWRFSLSGTVVGSYLALIFWLAGLKYTEAGVAAILNQTSTIYVLILATVFLKESFTKRKIAAAVMAVGGILVVTVL